MKNFVLFFSYRFLEKTYLIEERNHTVNNDYFVSENNLVFNRKKNSFFFF